jgi:simple sugar transport system ATP-binding protein
MSVADNVVLGEEVTHGVLLDQAEAARRVRELSQQYNLAVEPGAIIEELPVGMQQRVEIIKALYRDAEILILDEPTAVLTPQEVEDLFKIMRDLSDRGVSIISSPTSSRKFGGGPPDRRHARRPGGRQRLPAESTPEVVAALMVGREVQLRVHKEAARRKTLSWRSRA